MHKSGFGKNGSAAYQARLIFLRVRQNRNGLKKTRLPLERTRDLPPPGVQSVRAQREKMKKKSAEHLLFFRGLFSALRLD